MNKRLVELYKQATKTAYKTVGVEHANTSYFQGIVTGMFAELIVRECMDCATWVGKMNTSPVEPIHTAHAINQCIKKRFGVE